jgi:MFS family permease
MSSLPGGVWRHPAFLKLWAGQATSMFGSLIGGLAYSLVAILTLHAVPWQIAALNACSLVPGMVAGPWIGVLADRVRHRPLLIAADLTRALALASIPAAAVTHTLTMVQLDAVAALVSALTMLFDVSFRAYVPLLLGREQLVEGNTALRGTEAVAEAGGFAAAGLLVQIFTAPIAVGFDAISFLLSSLALTTIRDPRRQPRTHGAERPHTREEIVEGARTVWRDPILRTLTLRAVAAEVVDQPIGVVIMLFFVHDLHLVPAQMGPLFGIGGVSAFTGAVLCRRVMARWGIGPALIGGMYFDSLGLLGLVLTGGPMPLVLLLVGLEQLTDGGRAIYEIGVTSIIQSQAPEGVRGRVFATYETLRSLAMLLGLLLGAVLGELIELRGVLAIVLVGRMLVPLILVFSPLRTMREIPDEEALEGAAV